MGRHAAPFRKDHSVDVVRRDFLKCCIGSAAALGLHLSPFGTLEKALAASTSRPVPTYPIAGNVYTTLERTVARVVPPAPYPSSILLPCQVYDYTLYGYGKWGKDGNGYPDGPAYPYVRPPMEVGGPDGPPPPDPSDPDPLATPLLSFFTISDVHIADKESPAQSNYVGYTYPEVVTPDGDPIGSSSAYSAVILYTTHVLDAAVQTINALHKAAPFDFGIGLGDAANNTQFNELRWYIDVLDGKKIIPSSGAHKGAKTVEFQKPYQAAGLDKSLPWYQTIGNHDQFWMGSSKVTDYLRKTYVGRNVLNTGLPLSVPPDFNQVLNARGYYMGVVDGTSEYGQIIDAGPVEGFVPPPKVAPDSRRRSLTASGWMSEFFDTTTEPAGHGFTQEMVKSGFACYSFHPRSNIPIKVIVLDDTDKVGCGAAGALDQERYGWLVNELDEGEAAGELMIICAHIPLLPYAQTPTTPGGQDFPLWSTWAPYSQVSENTVLAKLHTYKNLVLWCSGHVHRNAITPQPSPDETQPEYSFWEVETPSLRDYPQQLRRFQIVFNTDRTLSIFALDVDTAANPALLADGSASPPSTSRSYAVACQAIFQNPIPQGPNVDPNSGVYNAELVLQLSQEMQEKLANLAPVVGYFKINNDDAVTPGSRTVALNNNVLGSAPAEYMASQSSKFKDAQWLPYSQAPAFTLSKGSGSKTVYFKVRDDAGRVSETVKDSIGA